MVRIEKDSREWYIIDIRKNSDCSYLSYPANYHACNHPKVECPGETECNMDICPIRDRRINGYEEE